MPPLPGTDKLVSVEEIAMTVSKKGITECPIDTALSVIDGRWKGTILWRLQDGPMRTAEFAPQHHRHHRADADPPSA
jgi:hypothetical protein